MKSNILVEAAEAAKGTKQFIAPKKAMQMSMQNDTQYLQALAHFIDLGRKEIEKGIDSVNNSRLQIEILDAVAKFHANQGLLNDKLVHYEKIFLPRYEKELEESRKEFVPTMNKVKETIENMASVENPLVDYMREEVKNFEESADKDDEEFQAYTYKILRRLLNKFNESI